MSRFLIGLLISIGLLSRPIDVFGQYINSAIHTDSTSPEGAISILKHPDNRDFILGALLDTSNKSFPLLVYSDSNNSFSIFKKAYHSCTSLIPVSTNQLGKQNGQYYFLANCNPSFNKFEIYKILIDSLGDTISIYRINNNDTSLARRTHFLPNGQMILLGQNPSEYFVQKWEDDSLLWTYQSDVNSPIILQNILMDGNDIVVSGRIGIYNNNPGSDLFVAKINKDGQLLWALRKDLGESEVGGNIIRLNNNYLVSYSIGKWNSVYRTLFIGEISQNGNWLNEKQIGVETRDNFPSTLMLIKNEIFCFATESNKDSLGFTNSILYKLNQNFEVLFRRAYFFRYKNKVKSSLIIDVKQQEDSTIKTIGVLYNGPGGQDLWYLHLDKHGCLTPGCEANDVNVEEVFFGDNNEVLIYPNPAQTTLNLQFSQNQSGQISLYNLQGVQVKKLSFNQTQNIIISVDDLPEGLYFIQVETSSGERFVKRFVVNSP